MKRINTPSACALAAAVGIAIVACGGSDNVMDINSGTVIRNVTVVNTRDGGLSQRMAVVVDQGKIRKIVATETIRITGSAQEVDGSGKYLVPGFLDMHTHLLNASETELPLLGKLFVANGITGVREMGGSAELVRRAQQFNTDLAAAKFDAPEILAIPGQIISAGAPAAASVMPAAATLEVQAQKAYGAGFIKTIGATRDATLALLAEARKQGLGVAGHLNPTLSAKDSANAGWRAVEHLGGGSTGMLLDCSSDEDALRALILSGNGAPTPPVLPTWSATPANANLYQRVYDSYDPARCATVAQAFAKNETWHIPTLVRNRTMRFVDDAAYRSDPNLVYVSPATRVTWEAAAQRQLAAVPADSIALFHRYFDRELGLAKVLKQNGVKMLTGSDTSIHPVLSATWVVPGFALHQEFALLAKAGLAPLEILQMTTLNGAQFLNRETTMGTVEEGRYADLVLLDANPLDSAANLGKIAAVFLKGKYLPAAVLARMKSDVAAAYASQQLTAAQRSAALAAPVHVD